MKSKNNGMFMLIILVGIVALMGLLAYLSSVQEEERSVGLPTVKQLNETSGKKAVDFDYENQPSIGDEKAPVKVVMFGDYKCPACKMWEQGTYPQLKKDYIDTGKVEFYFINYQFKGRDAYLAGVAGEAIYKQSEKAFWQYHHLIYEKQGSEATTWATHAYLKKLVKENIKGIDYKLFEKDMENYDTFLKEVLYDREIATLYSVNSTPSIFVEGVFIAGGYDAIELAIEASLKGEKSKIEASLIEEAGKE